MTKAIEWNIRLNVNQNYSCIFNRSFSGPETWWVYYPSASGGNQSPIDILTEDTLVDMEFGLAVNPLRINYSSAAAAAAAAVAAAGASNMSGSTGSQGEMLTLVNTGTAARVDVINSHSCTYEGLYNVSTAFIRYGWIAPTPFNITFC
jgi:hypothetical protein